METSAAALGIGVNKPVAIKLLSTKRAPSLRSASVPMGSRETSASMLPACNAFNWSSVASSTKVIVLTLILFCSARRKSVLWFVPVIMPTRLPSTCSSRVIGELLSTTSRVVLVLRVESAACTILKFPGERACALNTTSMPAGADASMLPAPTALTKSFDLPNLTGSICKPLWLKKPWSTATKKSRSAEMGR